MNEHMNLLSEGLKIWNKELNHHQLEQFQQYMNILLEWNEKFNLTAITVPRDIIIHHFLDSLSIGLLDLPLENARVLDMGSGAGFPGIPLKIMYPDIQLMLVDSVNKKTQFLKEVTTQLGLSKTEILHSRAEDLGKDKQRREGFDVVVSRAVAELRVLAEYCIPFVRMNGHFISYKGPGAMDELTSAHTAIASLGGTFQQIADITVPFSEKTHKLVVIKKTTKTPNKYPRESGKPKKSPL